MKKNNTSISELERNQRIEDSKYLKYGDIIAIANTVECSKQAVHQFIKGSSNSKRISKAFDEFVKARKESLAKGIAENL
tara:strand:+ start:216 stop:452 length:237 start_codon:yes stop_codon:yes gene_type:complete